MDLHRHAIDRFARKLQAGIASGNAFHCRITTDRELRRLNREFRGEDRATDVLSFPAWNWKKNIQPPINADEGRLKTKRPIRVHRRSCLSGSPDINEFCKSSDEAPQATARNGHDARIGFVPSGESVSARSSALVYGIGDSPEIGFVFDRSNACFEPPTRAGQEACPTVGNSPEIGFVPSNRLRVDAPPKIGLVFTRRTHAGEGPDRQSKVRRKKSETGRSARGGARQTYLGDIAISLPRARIQARAFGHSVEQECGILMLHGLLHLLGMDHETDGGRMARFERRWRARLGLPAGLIERVEP